MKKILFSVIFIVLFVLMSVLGASAAGFTNNLPTYVNISGGAWFEVYDSDYGQATCVFPIEFKDRCFGFSLSDTNLPTDIVNVTNSTVYGYVYTRSGEEYSARCSRFSGIEIQISSGSYSSQWVKLNPDVVGLDNSNMTFITEDSLYINDAVPDYNKFYLAIFTFIAFCEFLGLCVNVLRRGRR